MDDFILLDRNDYTDKMNILYKCANHATNKYSNAEIEAYRRALLAAYDLLVCQERQEALDGTPCLPPRVIKPVEAHWVPVESNDSNDIIYKCSNCDNAEWSIEPETWEHCPWCGARMYGVGEPEQEED